MKAASAPIIADERRLHVPEGHALRKVPVVAGAIGLAGLIATAVLGFAQPKQALFSYLVAFVFCTSIAVGGLFFVLLQFVTRAGWSVVVRRTAENLMGTIPLLAVMFLPIALGLQQLYPWAQHDVVMHDELIRGKIGYLNQGFFLARSAVILIAWAGIALIFRAQSVRQDQSGDHAITRKLQAWSAPALVVFAFTTSFAGFDWLMSLDPHWFSTIYGVYFFSGGVVGMFAFLAVAVTALSRAGLLRNLVTTEHFHDIGKLMFAFVAFWAYIAFSQYFLIWYANIPEETVWFAHRWTGSWQQVSVVVGLGHFVIPFFFLLPRTVKRKPTLLVFAAVWLLAMHYVDMYWLAMPVLHPEGAAPSLLDVTALIGLSGLLVSTFAWLTVREAVIPARDPRLGESLSFENV